MKIKQCVTRPVYFEISCSICGKDVTGDPAHRLLEHVEQGILSLEIRLANTSRVFDEDRLRRSIEEREQWATFLHSVIHSNDRKEGQ